MATKFIGLKLDTVRDADILEWLEAQDNVSRAVREAIREHMSDEREAPALDESILRRILREELSRVSIAASGDGQSPVQKEDEEAAEMLESLLGTFEAFGKEE